MNKKVTFLGLLLGLSAVTLTNQSNAQDNLGNHTATQNLNMSNFEIDNVSFLDFRSGPNYGIRFWGGQDVYSIKMGSSSDYQYGPVTSYAIKNNMWSSSTFTNRGWTWGSNGQTPVAALNTAGTLQLAKDLYSLGNVGINTTTPAERLHIQDGNMLIDNGRIHLTGTNSYGGPMLVFGDNKQWGLEYVPAANGNPGMNFWKPWTGTPGQLAGNYFLFISDDGDVSIGTNDSQGYKFAVKGNMIAEEVVVKLHADWPDFVFTNTYGLMDLKEVESYIEENAHLPNVPSAQEVQEKGINLGEMDGILLQKIEELTLYVIQLQKEVEQQQKLIEALENQ